MGLKPGSADPGTASIGNRVFLDDNGNGVLDGNEGGFAGARVTLRGAGNDGAFGTADDVVRTQTTASGGYYGFGNLAAGQYKVTVDNLPSGVGFTQANVGGNDHIDSDVNVSNGTTDIINLSAGQVRTDIDAGVVKSAPVDPKTASIGNRVFLDDNGNGVLDGNEGGFAGARVTLRGAGNDGAFGTADDVVRTQTTASGGYYGFGNLAAGQYKVTVDNLPSGVAFTQANVGGNDHIDSDVNVSNGTTDTISLTAGQVRNDIDAGVVKSSPVDPKTASIGNRVFLDDNGNGVLDGNEGGFAGARVTLRGAGNDGAFGTADDVVRTQTTASGGYYGFGNLAAGQYKVTVDNLPGSVEFTQANVGGNDNIDSDVNVSNGTTDTINLTAGQVRNDIDAGVKLKPVAKSSIGDRVWFDNNGNGSQDSGEAGVQGVEVTLTGGGADGIIGNQDDTGRTALTDVNGLYKFDNLNPGEEYQVSFAGLPDGYEFTAVDSGRNDVVDSDANPSTGATSIVKLAPGEHNATLDAGIVRSAPVNIAPNATDDSASTAFNTAVTVNALGNDTDPDGDALSVTSLNGQSISVGNTVATTNGSVTLLDGGQLRFNPNTGFSGAETFSYHVSDGKGGEDTANVQVNVRPGVKATLVGDTSIHEGGKGSYFVQLDQASDQDRYFTLKVHDGTAKRFDGNINGQDVNGSSDGGYSVGTSAYNILYRVFDRVPNGTALSSGDRPQVGPSAQNRDFNVTKNDVLNSGDTIQVKVAAGQTQSESIHINAALEKVTIDNFLTPHGLNAKAVEGTENFSVKIADAGDAVVLNNTVNVNINDKTAYRYVSPITLDLNGDGIQTLSLDQGVQFDLFNTGAKVNTGWLSGEDGFLAIDNSGNGSIDDRSELFGGSIGDGFAKLATFDSNSDGWVNSSDINFGQLQIWQDANEDAITNSGELISLAQAGIEALKVDYIREFNLDAQGNLLGERSSAQTSAGKSIDMIDVYFQVANSELASLASIR